jgi:hypothetical protein
VIGGSRRWKRISAHWSVFPTLAVPSLHSFIPSLLHSFIPSFLHSPTRPRLLLVARTVLNMAGGALSADRTSLVEIVQANSPYHVEQWYDWVKEHTFDTLFVPLAAAHADAIVAYRRVGCYTLAATMRDNVGIGVSWICARSNNRQRKQHTRRRSNRCSTN